MPTRRPKVLLLLLGLALAGAVGTLARYGLSVHLPRLLGTAFPWATLIINVLGCFLFGLVWELAEYRRWLGPEQRVVLLTGFMGAFTTYSTFAFETGLQIREEQWWLVFANMGAHLALGLVGLFLGFAVGRWGA